MHPGLLMVDIMHTLDLGVAPRLAGHIMIFAVKHGVFGPCTGLQGLKAGIGRMNLAWRAYFRRAKWGTQGRPRGLRLTMKSLMVSSMSDTGHLKAKARPSRSALGFAFSLLKRQDVPDMGLVEAGHLRRAAKALLSAYELMSTGSRQIDSNLLGRRLEACFQHAKLANVRPLPKFHLMRHLWQLSARAGNPECFSCYMDEDHHRGIVATAQKSFSADFSARILSKERCLLRLQRKKPAEVDRI